LNTTELLEGLKKDAEKNISSVQHFFEALRSSQLNWKPSPDKWSIAQCIDHLNVYDKLYLIRFRKVLITGKKQFFSKDHYKPSLLGNYFIRQVDPKLGTQRYTAPAVFQPSQSEVEPGGLLEFIRLQRLLIDIMEKAKRYDLKKNRVATPVTDLVRLRFGDAMIVVVRHDQRHLQQALRVIENPGFPK
jgi:hypothetical protein